MRPKQMTVREYGNILLDVALGRIDRDKEKRKEWLDSDSEAKGELVTTALHTEERQKLVGMMIQEEKKLVHRNEFIIESPNLDLYADELAALMVNEDTNNNMDLVTELVSSLIVGAMTYARNRMNELFENLLTEKDWITNPSI